MKKILSYFFQTSTNRSSEQALGRKQDEEVIQRNLFLKLIEMERLRVHRSNKQFSLILFNIDQDPETAPSIDKLANIISQRIRRTDQVGWFDDCRIGVLLPNTPMTGAQTIANIISTDMSGELEEPKDRIPFETLSYPDLNQSNKRN